MNLNEYRDTGRALYDAFAQAVHAELKKAIDAGDGLKPLSIQFRAKADESLELKLRSRGLVDSADIERELRDLAGVRVIFYTETDVDRFLASRIIPEAFNVDWSATRIHYPTSENDQLRYQAFHYTVSLSEAAIGRDGNAQFAGLRCEIQVQTLLNHAWAEAHHDRVYKAGLSPGFGKHQLDAIDKRLKKIMDDYLKPAALAFQQVQHDYERLLEGKALFDRGTLESLEGSADNNVRHGILSTLLEHVIPNYDDIAAVYPDLRRGLVNAVSAARDTATQDVATSFGPIPGRTAEDVAQISVRILDTLRLVDIEETFLTLCTIYRAEESQAIRKQIRDVVERLARFDLNIWEQAGPVVQVRLAALLERIPASETEAIRPLLVIVWGEMLSSALNGTTWAARSATFRNGAVPHSDTIQDLRKRAIKALTAVLDEAQTDRERRETIAALRACRSLPTQARYSNEMLAQVLRDTKTIAEIIGARTDTLSYETREHVEHGFLFDFRRDLEIATNEKDPFGCRALAEEVCAAILSLRDFINRDARYVHFKTLVGFEAVFPQHWEDSSFDYRGSQPFRTKEAERLAASITEETEPYWRDLILRCAASDLTDGATFPAFNYFLQVVGEQRPAFLFVLVESHDEHLLRFLPHILEGLAKSAQKARYFAFLDDAIGRGEHLIEIARHCRISADDMDRVVGKVLERSTAGADPIPVCECVVYAVEKFPHRPDVRSTIFVPGLSSLSEKRDARWVRGAWYLKSLPALLNALDDEQEQLVLRNLVWLTDIDSEAEFVLRPLARRNCAAVLEYFGWRHERADASDVDNYEAIPYQLYELSKEFDRHVDLLVDTARSWHQPGDTHYSHGAKLVHAAVPKFTAALGGSLKRIATRGEDADFEFLIHVLRNYTGEEATHDVLKELADRFAENQRRLEDVEICLEGTGVVVGDFGMAEAFKAKKATLQSWLADERPRVREFAAAAIKRLDNRIAMEQRRAEHDRAQYESGFDQG